MKTVVRTPTDERAGNPSLSHSERAAVNSFMTFIRTRLRQATPGIPEKLLSEIRLESMPKIEDALNIPNKGDMLAAVAALPDGCKEVMMVLLNYARNKRDTPTAPGQPVRAGLDFTDKQVIKDIEILLYTDESH